MNDSYVGCRQCSLRSACVLPIAVVKGRFCLLLPDIGRFADEWLDLNSANQNRFNSWQQHTPPGRSCLSSYSVNRAEISTKSSYLTKISKYYFSSIFIKLSAAILVVR